MYKLDCSSAFWAEEMEWQKVRVGVFVTKTESWVEKSDIPFRAWTAMLERMASGGFLIIIFDSNDFDKCGGNATMVHLEDLVGMQQDFVEFCRSKRQLQVNEIWLVRDGDGKQSGNSLRLTSRWLQSILSKWREWPYTQKQLRDAGYIKVDTTQKKRKMLPSESAHRMGVHGECQPATTRRRESLSAPNRSPSVVAGLFPHRPAANDGHSLQSHRHQASPAAKSESSKPTTGKRRKLA
jgi:hypothetical protein